MKDWNTKRLEINRKIRSILVTYFIDLGKLSVHVYPAKVSFRGTLTKMTGSPGSLTADVMRQMFTEIERVQGVRRVVTTLDNWVQRGAHDWVSTTKQPANPQAMKSSRSHTDVIPADARTGSLHKVGNDYDPLS